MKCLPRDPRAWKVLLAATLSNLLALLPPFLLGALSVFMRRDISFDSAQLGFSVALYFAASAAFSIPGGRLAERIGPRRSLTGASVLSALSIAGIGLLAHDFVTLLVLLAFGGLANGVAQPAANLAVSRGISVERQGLAFGTKQSAILLATLVAGLAVSLLAAPFGWRSAFIVVGPTLLLPLLVAYPPRRGRAPVAANPRTAVSMELRGGGLALLAVASGCVMATTGTLGVFLVESGVDAGLSPSAAGLVQSCGSAVGVAARLLIGWSADRGIRQPLRVVTLMLLAGMWGFVALAVDLRIAFVVGSVLAFAAGWGWSGLFIYAVVRAYPEAPAAATGVTQTGFSGGNVFGPVAFGWIVATWSYEVAWLAAGGLCAAGALLMWRGSVVVRRSGRDGSAPRAPSAVPSSDRC